MEIVTDKPIKPQEVYEQIQKQGSGSVIFHFAVVREKTEGKITTSIEFHRDGDVEGELNAIAGEIRSRWKVEDVLIIRRLGTLKIGDIISLVAVSSPHRGDAFDACRNGVERLKKMETIKKSERFE
ncbi:MAG: molybdenum cofactor biosynthesis protein MoaE [bacterium]